MLFAARLLRCFVRWVLFAVPCRSLVACLVPRLLVVAPLSFFCLVRFVPFAGLPLFFAAAVPSFPCALVFCLLARRRRLPALRFPSVPLLPLPVACVVVAVLSVLPLSSSLFAVAVFLCPPFLLALLPCVGVEERSALLPPPLYLLRDDCCLARSGS